MSIFDNLFKKEFPGVSFNLNYPISHTSKTGKALHEEGYKYNVVVYRCVESIIKSLKGIDIAIKQGDSIIEDHDALTLLKKPNPSQGQGAFLTEAFVNRLVIGEMFLVTADNALQPQEIWNLDPLEMKILPGHGIPRAYIQKVNNNEKRFDVDQITGKSEVFYWKGYNPTDKWRGMSPLNAASLAADTNNAGLRWNFSLLKKGARGSGIVTFKEGGTLDEGAVSRLRKYFKSTMQGENNAGEIPILTGGADFKEIGKSPKDMDYSKTVDATTAFIAMAYGVPLPLVLNNAATFNNFREGKELFYTDTVLPLFGEYLEELSKWLLPKFGLEDAKFIYDPDSIPALETIRERRNDRMTKLVEKGIISPDEAREELGYEKRGGIADFLFMPSSAIPMEENTDRNDDDIKALLKKQGFSDEDIETAMKES